MTASNTQPMRSKHFQTLGYYNGNGDFVPTRFTLQYRLEGDKVAYRFACCSHSEKQYVKRIGNQLAQDKPIHYADFGKVVDSKEPVTDDIIMAALIDIETNHADELPNHHQKFFEINSPLRHWEMVTQRTEDPLRELIESMIGSLDDDGDDDGISINTPTIH